MRDYGTGAKKCTQLDSEEYDKEYVFTSAQQCAAAVADAGFRYFQFRTGAAKTAAQDEFGACQACVNSDTTDIA